MKDLQKYDFVYIRELKDMNLYYENLGQNFIDAKAMVIGRNDSFEEFQIELCFFDEELQELAIEEGFDYWQEDELELI